jgi:hypothetical protein
MSAMSARIGAAGGRDCGTIRIKSAGRAQAIWDKE